MSALIETALNRPYVVAFLVSFLFMAWAEIGATRAFVWLIVGAALGWLSEFFGTRTGLPYGVYQYHPESFAGEVSIAGIPLFASLSFAFLTYFGYSAARTLLSPLARRGLDLIRVERESHRRSFAVLLLGTAVVIWMDVAIDPVSLLGAHWFLGDLYHYERSATAHFGVPLSNYAGWALTAATIIYVNQLADSWLTRKLGAPRTVHLPLKGLMGVLGCAGVFVFVTSVAGSLALGGSEVAAVAGGVFASSLAATLAFIALAVVKVRYRLSRTSVEHILVHLRDFPSRALAHRLLGRAGLRHVRGLLRAMKAGPVRESEQ